MRSNPIRIRATWLLLGAAAGPGFAQVVSWEGTSFPEAEQWNRTAFCTPERTLQNGWLHQAFDVGECGQPPGGDRETYRRAILDLEGAMDFFLEFRVLTTGERSEIAGGAPVAVAASSFGSVAYNFFIARDGIKFIRDVSLPIILIDLEPEIAHVIRLEFYNRPQAAYAWYLDGRIAGQGLAEGPYPSFQPEIVWQGRSWYLPNETRWDYLRYGLIPLDGSGDYDSDGSLTLDDFYFFHECLSNRRPGINGGPGMDAGPGCRFADFDADSSTDLSDFANFQRLFDQAP